MRRFAAPKYAPCHGRLPNLPKRRILLFGHASQGVPNSSKWYSMPDLEVPEPDRNVGQLLEDDAGELGKTL